MAEWLPTDKYTASPSSQHARRPTFSLQRCEEMARNGRLQEALRLFAEAFDQGKVEKQQLKSLAAALVKFQMNKMEQEVLQKALKEERGEQPIEDILVCSLCKAMYTEPVTLPCGHSFCKFCLQDGFTSGVCTTCGAADTEEVKAPTFLLCNIIVKCFPSKYKLGLKKIEGRTFMNQGSYDKAVEVFSLVLCQEPTDINCLSWRAECYFCLGTFTLALKDIDLACGLHNSVRLLLRKSKILWKLGEREKTVSILLQCAAREPHNIQLREELESGLYELFRLDFSNLKQAVTPTNLFTCERKGVSLSNDRNLNKTDKDVVDCNLVDTSLQPLSKNFDKENEALKSKGDNLIEDFECKLCCNLLYKPVTSPCGHIFCRDCLRRSLDHRVECPCCRTPLNKYLAERRDKVTVVLETIIKKLFAKEYENRDQSYKQEMLAMKRSVEASEFEISIFICTLAFPFVPCPLHIFEPPYKLMIRRCIESGLKQFGMCVASKDSTFPTVGTILKIEEVAYLPDGRSLVNTVGTRRFRVLSHYKKDGYYVAKVKCLVDEVEEEVEEITNLHLNGYKMVKFWFNNLTTEQQSCIVHAIGNMPKQEELDSSKINQPSWLWWALAALPLQDKPKLIILGMTSVVERLRSIMRFLMLIIKMQKRNHRD